MLVFFTVVEWRNIHFWKVVQQHGLLVDQQNTRGWRHGRQGKQARWENQLAKVYGEDWLKVAAEDREGWKRLKGKFA